MPWTSFELLEEPWGYRYWTPVKRRKKLTVTLCHEAGNIVLKREMSFLFTWKVGWSVGSKFSFCQGKVKLEFPEINISMWVPRFLKTRTHPRMHTTGNLPASLNAIGRTTTFPHSLEISQNLPERSYIWNTEKDRKTRLTIAVLHTTKALWNWILKIVRAPPSNLSSQLGALISQLLKLMISLSCLSKPIPSTQVITYNHSVYLQEKREGP